MWAFSQAYIDDVVVCSAPWSNHCDHLVNVLQKLQCWSDSQVFQMWVGCCLLLMVLLLAMVEDGQRSARWLPFRTSRDRRPRVTSDSYRHVIPNFTSHSFFLSEATKKCAPDTVVWTDDIDSEYVYFKNSLCSAPRLYITLPSDLFCVQTDASGVGIGAVLSMTCDGQDHPVAHIALLSTKQCLYLNYSPTVQAAIIKFYLDIF